MRAGLFLTCALLLAGCQTAGSNATGSDPMTGDAIEVSTLEAPVVGLAEEQAAENREPGDADVAAAAEADIATEPAEQAVVEPLAEPEVAEPVVIDPVLLTPEALACQRRGGQWTKIGEGEGRSCVRRTRDAGKRCDADRDCQGVCLARSQTCAPVDPLFGCNEVLQDDGRRMTLCLD